MPNTDYTYFPQWIGNKTMMYGIVTLLVAIAMFSSRFMPFYLYVFFILEVGGFCYYSQTLTHKWGRSSQKLFLKRIFLWGILLRVPLTLYYHVLNTSLYGSLYCFHLPDLGVYVGLPYQAVEAIYNKGDFNFVQMFLKYLMIDDLGAPIFNTILLLITGNLSPCGVPLFANVIMGAYTSVFVYKITERHFGEDIARMAAIFCMLNPNMIWWCSSLFKETQMLFFTCWFLERMDALLCAGKFPVNKVVFAALIGVFVFFYRAALGVLLFLVFFLAIIFASKRVVTAGKKLLVGLVVALMVVVGFGNRMLDQTRALTEQVQSGGQQANMEWRSRRENGNQFAQYAGAAVFAPLIFTIPFPTITYTHAAQIPLMEVAGGNFIKNVFSLLVMISLLIIVTTGEWRQHVFLGAYLLGYLAILVLSPYAQSGRFHIPAIPFEMMFAAYGIKLIQQNQKVFKKYGSRVKFKRLFGYWCFLMFVICIGWQWFKLKGQGLI